MESESEPLLRGHEVSSAAGGGGGQVSYDSVAAVAEDGRRKGSESSDSSLSSSSSGVSRLSSRSRVQFWTEVAIFIGSTLMGGMAMSIFTPFYTKEATAKGLTVSQSGLVYASIYLTTIIFMPLLSKSIDKIGANRMFTTGICLCGASNLALGQLKHANGASLFFGLSILVLVMSAIGASALFSSVYPLATKTVSPRYRATILSVMETSFGIGMMTAPSFGGFLYDFGGFDLPFTVCGGLLVLFSIISALVLRRIKDRASSLDSLLDDEEELPAAAAPSTTSC